MFRLFYITGKILMFGSTFDSKSNKNATKYSYSRGDPSFTFLLKILFFLSLFFLNPVVVDTVY